MSHNHKKNNRGKPVGEELPVDQPQEQPEDLEEQTSQIIQSGSVTMTAAKHVIHCLTIGTLACGESTFVMIPI